LVKWIQFASGELKKKLLFLPLYKGHPIVEVMILILTNTGRLIQKEIEQKHVFLLWK